MVATADEKGDAVVEIDNPSYAENNSQGYCVPRVVDANGEEVVRHSSGVNATLCCHLFR